jgi:hypothetical protein
MPAKKKKIPNAEQPLPLFCDFSCPHADFSKDVSGACRRELVVYCTLIKKYNNKHNRCLAREQVGAGK